MNNYVGASQRRMSTCSQNAMDQYTLHKLAFYAQNIVFWIAANQAHCFLYFLIHWKHGKYIKNKLIGNNCMDIMETLKSQAFCETVFMISKTLWNYLLLDCKWTLCYQFARFWISHQGTIVKHRLHLHLKQIPWSIPLIEAKPDKEFIMSLLRFKT